MFSDPASPNRIQNLEVLDVHQGSESYTQTVHQEMTDWYHYLMQVFILGSNHLATSDFVLELEVLSGINLGEEGQIVEANDV